MSITGHHLIDIMVIMVTDRADIEVSQLYLYEIEACDINYGNKLGQAATGNLI